MNTPHPPADPQAEPGQRGKGWGLWCAAAVSLAVAVVLLLPTSANDQDVTRSGPAAQPTETAPQPTTSPEPQGRPTPDGRPEVGGEPAATEPTAVPSAPASPLTGTDSTLQDLDAEREGLPIARGFATDFATPGTDVKDWHRRLSRWTTEQLAEQYQLVAYERIPAGRLLTLEPDAVGEHIVEFTARYDTGLVITGRAVTDGTAWKISAAQPG
jgi:hypothetical protein